MQKLIEPEKKQYTAEELDEIKRANLLAWAQIKWEAMSSEERALLHAECEGKRLLEEAKLCLVCKGKNWVYKKGLEPGHRDFGRAFPCSHTFKELKDDPHYETFNNWHKVPGAEATFEAVKALAEGESPYTLLLVIGQFGNGKTHLCRAAMHTSQQRGVHCKYFYAPDLVNELHKFLATKEIRGAYEAFYQTLLDTLFLVLDDLGVGANIKRNRFGAGLDDWAGGQVEALIKARYQTFRPTLVTTNLDLTVLPAVLQSVFGDKEVAKWIVNNARDYRPRKKM